jgi:hypothetical protein
MTSKAPSTVLIFYSWQSDHPGKTNRYFLHSCLKSAKNDFDSNANNALSLYIDESTRDKPGAPHIPDTILKKIAASDILVADLTTINTNPSGSDRPTPNPNVLIELGFAVGRLGWDRMILVFNSEFGKFPNDLPFDIDRRRVIPYSISETDDTTIRKKEMQRLSNRIKEGINAIISVNPPRPMDHWISGVHRSRDVEMLSMLCATFNLDCLHQHCEDIQRGFVSDELLYYYEYFSGTLSGLSFHLYDTKAHDMTKSLLKAWSDSIPPSRHTESASHGYIFRSQNPQMSSEEQAAWDIISNAAKPFYDSLKLFADYIRNEYVEIDLSMSSRQAKFEWSK